MLVITFFDHFFTSQIVGARLIHLSKKLHAHVKEHVRLQCNARDAYDACLVHDLIDIFTTRVWSVVCVEKSP